MSYHFAGRLAAFGFIAMLVTGAHAQTTVLNLNLQGAYGPANISEGSAFTFKQSLILNEIGFVTIPIQTLTTFEYKIGTGGWQQLTDNQLEAADSTGVRYYRFDNPSTYASGTTIRLRSSGHGIFGLQTATAEVDGGSNTADVTFDGFDNGNFSVPFVTSGNIKVTNPGSNVAPEPGTFALALTGGGALLGICIRRRRSAA